MLIHLSVPWDRNMSIKEDAKITTLSSSKGNQRLCHWWLVFVGVVSGQSEGFSKDLGIPDVFGGIQGDHPDPLAQACRVLIPSRILLS